MADGGQQNEQYVGGLNVMKGLIIYSGRHNVFWNLMHLWCTVLR